MIEIKNNYVKVVKNKKKYNRRQDVPKVYEANASIYIWKREFLINKKSLFTKKTGIYVMPESRSIDIDNMHDFKLVEFLIKNELQR